VLLIIIHIGASIPRIILTPTPFRQQNNDEAKGGKEFILMAGFPPRDLLARLNDTVESCKLAGEAISVRWKE